MLRNLWLVGLLLVGTAFSLQAHADYWFKVNDASQIQFLIGNPQVYLRNLNTFDSTVVGGSAPWGYHYWIDLSSDGGKADWATLLSKMEAHEPIWVYVSSQTADGGVNIGWFG